MEYGADRGRIITTVTPTWDDNGDQYLDASGEWVTAQTPQEGMTAILPAVLHRYYNLPTNR